MRNETNLAQYERIETLIRRNGMERAVFIGEAIGEFLVNTAEVIRRAVLATRRGYAQWRATTDAYYAGSPKRDLPYLE